MNEANPVTAILVEDQELVRKMLTQALSVLGCEVVGEAEDGLAAVELFTRNRPDLVLMNIRMPRADGVEALTAIRREDPDAYVIMVTSVDEEETVENCMIAGARDFIRKDAPVEKTVARLERHVSRLR